MGLDQYLYADSYLSHYKYQDNSDFGKGVAKFDAVVDVLGLKDAVSPDSPHLHVRVCVAYWRKANAIHNWFVQNVQDGNDNCQLSYVSREDLQILLNLAREELVAYDKGEAGKGDLTPTSGFFFDSTSIDGYYKQDMQDTVDQLTAALKLEDVSFYYQASW